LNSSLPESAIVKQLQDPEERKRIFEQLVNNQQQPVYYFVRKMVLDHEDTHDICQEVFIKVWKGLNSFRGESKLSTWLFRIAHNETITFINKKKRLAGVPLELVEHELGTALQSDELFTGDEIQKRLQVAIATLPTKQKAVFLMRYYDETPYEEMAEITGTSVGALKASYHHAVKKVENILTQG
jgi:RNA polymerase sigma factor (sigma-70 family)